MRTAEAAFESIGLSSVLLQVVRELGFARMTPVQSQAIPLLLAGKDLIGQAKTGSGKTLAFTLPILQEIELRSVRDARMQALVLCPTRELCTQVAREMRKLGRRHAGLQVLILSGGQPLYPQLTALEKGVHIVVGTPGRVLDHLNRGTLNLRDTRFLVLDEADRMLDMGFQEDMEKILNEVPKRRQTVFFSATFPRSIEAMSKAYQREPVRVTIEDSPEAAPDIHQISYETASAAKAKTLSWILQQHSAESALVFCNLKATVAELARELAGSGVSVDCLHGDLEQACRDRVLAKFRNHSVRVLVATDVAARGLDVQNLDLVCNFDLPSQPEVYVHRIGRTGRAGKRGVAISLVTTRDLRKLSEIEKATKVPVERRMAELPEAESAPGQGFRREAAMETLYIAAGRKDKMRPGDILGALTGEAGGLSAADVGKIEIHDRFSYVAVSKSIAQTALSRLREGRIKGRKFRIEMVK